MVREIFVFSERHVSFIQEHEQGAEKKYWAMASKYKAQRELKESMLELHKTGMQMMDENSVIQCNRAIIQLNDLQKEFERKAKK